MKHESGFISLNPYTLSYIQLIFLLNMSYKFRLLEFVIKHFFHPRLFRRHFILIRTALCKEGIKCP